MHRRPDAAWRSLPEDSSALCRDLAGTPTSSYNGGATSRRPSSSSARSSQAVSLSYGCVSPLPVFGTHSARLQCRGAVAPEDVSRPPFRLV